MPVTYEERLAWVLSTVPLLPETTVPIGEAHGLTLADDAVSRHDLPLWDNSAMDGYALRAADIETAASDRPVSLRIIGEVLAGSAENPVIGPGEAVRIMTGAPVPDSADAVIPVERTESDGETEWASEHVRVLVAVSTGANIRRRGEDTPEGAVIARAGSRLSGALASALAAAGAAEAPVRRAPRVGVLVTGAELMTATDAGTALGRGQIIESNSVLIAGMLTDSGLAPVSVRRCVDSAEAVSAQLAELSRGCDAIVTTGGVGPGSHDVVRIALEDEPEVTAARVAIRPGQPQCAGRLASGAYIFALPGNPVSAAVCFELFVRPALLAMQGRDDIHRLRVPAVAEVGWRGAVGRLQALPVRVWRATDGGLRCGPVVNPRGVSHAVGGHGMTDGYALVEADRGDVEAGETVDLILVSP